MNRTPSRGGQLGATYDTPHGFGDEPMSIDQELAIELESVKRERQQLMGSIAQVKAEAGVTDRTTCDSLQARIMSRSWHGILSY